MKTSIGFKRLVVDANPILSALIRGKANQVFSSPMVQELATTEHTVREVIEYIPELAARPRCQETGLTRPDLYFALVTAPLTVYRVDFYRDKLNLAQKRIGERDPDDVDLLALALKLGWPVWSNDNDFKPAGVKVWTTAHLLEKLGLG